MGRDILRVLAYADCAIVSGAELVFAGLVTELAARDDVTVGVAAPAVLRREIDAELSGFHEIDGQSARLAGLRLGRRRSPLSQAITRAYDVALVNLPSVELGIRGLALPLPTVGVLHISHRLDEIGFRLGRLRYLAGRRWVQMADRLIVVDPASLTRAVAELGFDADHVDVVPVHGRTITVRARSTARRNLDLAAEACVVGVIGRLNLAQKGQDIAVQALSHLDAAGGDRAILAIAGEGPDARAIKRLALTLGLSDRVRLLGAVDPSDFFAAVDAVAIPSRFEGLPLVALEALAAGCAGAATAVDGLRAVWPPDWLVPADEPAALAERLHAVLGLDRAVRAAHARAAYETWTRQQRGAGDIAAGMLRECLSV